jgi:hypothetical protein
MGTLIILSLSNLATSLLTAWLLHRKETRQSPVPALPSVIRGDEGENGEVTHETQATKGRQVL